MAKKRKTSKDEQLPLLDVAPENVKELTAIAETYREAMRERMSWLKDEVAAKTRLLAAVKDSGVIPDKHGTFRVRVGDDVVITVEPRDEKVSVSFKDAESDSSNE